MSEKQRKMSEEQWTKEEMIGKVAAILRQLYYEDIAFFCGFVAKLAEKKGISV